MANLTRAQRAAKVALTAADAAASAQTSSADQTKTGDSATAGDTPVAQNGADPEATNTTTASDATQGAAVAGTLDAASAPPVIEAAPVADAAIVAAGGGTPAAIEDQGGPTTQPTIGFPLRARVKNNTRMPVQVPALHLDLPASGEATITLYSEGDFKTLHSDLTALFSLNGFGEDAFSVSPAETTEA